MTNVQNYLPTYDRFFRLNTTNFNGVNLNHEWFLSDIKRPLYDGQWEGDGGEEEDDDDEDDDDEGDGDGVDGEIQSQEGTQDFVSLAPKLSDENLFVCQLTHRKNKHKTQERTVFFKLAPLFDPYKFFCGKLGEQDMEILSTLPSEQLLKFVQPSTDAQSTSFLSPSLCLNDRFANRNNAAYVDGFFVFLSSMLLHHAKFKHGIDFHGFFLGVKNNFRINVYDDFDYLKNDPFFQKQNGILFSIDENDLANYYDQKRRYGSEEGHESEDNSLNEQHSGKEQGYRRLHIRSQNDHGDDDANSENKMDALFGGEELEVTAEPVDDGVFEDVFEKDGEASKTLSEEKDDLLEEEIQPMDPALLEGTIEEEDEDGNGEDEDKTGSLKKRFQNQSFPNRSTAHSNSTCSSRSSHTDGNLEWDDFIEEEENVECCQMCTSPSECCEKGCRRDREMKKAKETEKDTETNDSLESAEPSIIATIPHFPVHVVCMEQCSNTLDDLLMHEILQPHEIVAALLQVVFILATYQKLFDFTHNDLHTNNIMFNETTDEFLYYVMGGDVFKVPTYGRIFKIIDFGRAIYRFHGQLFCSDSFADGNDASSQYNTEPFFNHEKPRVDPNYSFDLSRLGCALFDYVIQQPSKLYRSFDKCSPLEQLVFRWCLNDKGMNVLYKRNGEERYPNFKLYKMIARTVHHLIPAEEIKQPIFASYKIMGKEANQIIKKRGHLMIHIDNMAKMVEVSA